MVIHFFIDNIGLFSRTSLSWTILSKKVVSDHFVLARTIFYIPVPHNLSDGIFCITHQISSNNLLEHVWAFCNKDTVEIFPSINVPCLACALDYLASYIFIVELVVCFFVWSKIHSPKTIISYLSHLLNCVKGINQFWETHLTQVPRLL